MRKSGVFLLVAIPAWLVGGAWLVDRIGPQLSCDEFGCRNYQGIVQAAVMVAGFVFIGWVSAQIRDALGDQDMPRVGPRPSLEVRHASREASRAERRRWRDEWKSARSYEQQVRRWVEIGSECIFNPVSWNAHPTAVGDAWSKGTLVKVTDLPSGLTDRVHVTDGNAERQVDMASLAQLDNEGALSAERRSRRATEREAIAKWWAENRRDCPRCGKSCSSRTRFHIAAGFPLSGPSETPHGMVCDDCYNHPESHQQRG